ncbi:hypothetical protein P168DRAFT_321312 [Aspergillus campestris IBT 28561]|uniref:Uncharacterized protein n=1 Tax=Aspergillus campestris (strain IBT 28561) TaxID=1392248 RepID=A0A2I1CVU3_ASPC2|nr:uncharacterized protein P168DRAFT_321312 [Aspergillus campestris IBT 28561]PKY01741.1 hypothetical protein P168DRAFT_321312 [Aspergillus campestris IBT 28561]
MQANLIITLVVVIAVCTTGVTWLIYLRCRHELRRDLTLIRWQSRRNAIEFGSLRHDRQSREVRIVEEGHGQRVQSSNDRPKTSKGSKGGKGKGKNKGKGRNKNEQRTGNDTTPAENSNDGGWTAQDAFAPGSSVSEPAASSTSPPRPSTYDQNRPSPDNQSSNWQQETQNEWSTGDNDSGNQEQQAQMDSEWSSDGPMHGIILAGTLAEAVNHGPAIIQMPWL